MKWILWPLVLVCTPIAMVVVAFKVAYNWVDGTLMDELEKEME